MVMIFVAWAADLLLKARSQDRTVFLRARCVSEDVIPNQRCHRLIGIAERFLSFRGCRLLRRQPKTWHGQALGFLEVLRLILRCGEI